MDSIENLLKIVQSESSSEEFFSMHDLNVEAAASYLLSGLGLTENELILSANPITSSINKLKIGIGLDIFLPISVSQNVVTSNYTFSVKDRVYSWMDGEERLDDLDRQHPFKPHIYCDPDEGHIDEEANTVRYRNKINFPKTEKHNAWLNYSATFEQGERPEIKEFEIGYVVQAASGLGGTQHSAKHSITLIKNDKDYQSKATIVHNSLGNKIKLGFGNDGRIVDWKTEGSDEPINDRTREYFSKASTMGEALLVGRTDSFEPGMKLNYVSTMQNLYNLVNNSQNNRNVIYTSLLNFRAISFS